MPDSNRRAALFDQLAVVGKAFASAKRLELIDLLSQGERTVDSLAREAGLGLSTASAHLQVLKISNLVRTRREGTKIYYSLAGQDVATLYASMQAVAREHSADVDKALDAYLGVSGLGDVEEVTREELLERLAAGDVLLLDVRPPEEYAAGHIPGAVSVPFGEVAERMNTLEVDTDIVAYCRGAYCVLAHDAVRLLRAEGRQARRLQDGLLEWRLRGLPVEAGA
ncbi:Rhodanese-related sulfurtransferase [Actinopolymorpha cephalotaxi]|uniref:Rhodanese-related sulfurtransferase n=1 Tax=Actinopolymorpha cephalotaxi TaxID=504797 RepID=A0A1I3C1T1_9ACTN|nr:metalloregulator ArsR/SmtB family transcription factor [Actinopolymorpha cephalotaxi]NYH84085.1 rhodanese-related sulfurtransferase [Actinopolymorpha cephalotaxi]SFH68517.1 Rhodanese-related sulfurtransferase [Actinopolymorpha cephalotaxi]